MGPGAALRPLERGKRARGRPDAGALGEQRPREAPLARPFGRRDQRQVDDVALGMAAADPDCVSWRTGRIASTARA